MSKLFLGGEGFVLFNIFFSQKFLSGIVATPVVMIFRDIIEALYILAYRNIHFILGLLIQGTDLTT